MAGRICDSCGAAVSGDQFCPTCGAWVDQLTGNTDSGGDFESFSLENTPPPEEAPPVAQIPRRTVQCPSCGGHNPVANRHCEECGALLARSNMPIAPRPVVQSTAGTRAAMALAMVLVGIFVLVLLFKSFTAEDEPPTTSTSTSTTTLSLPTEALILTATCSIPGYATLECNNLKEPNTEYQFNWTSLPADREVTINLVTGSNWKINQLVWVNIADPTRFRQNYRAKTISITDGRPDTLPTVVALQDVPGEQVVTFLSRGTSKLIITITEVFSAETINGNVYPEFALQQIKILGNELTSTPELGSEITDDTTAG